MYKRLSYFTLIFWLFIFQSCSDINKKQEEEKPNIILILADDLGYGELGCFGQNIIETPNIDKLAEEGMKFTQFYTGAPVCAPARCVLLTGQHSGHAYIRGNDEWADRGNVWNYRAMLADSTLEGQRPMPLNTPTIATILKSNGYTTGMTGKWGLGAPHTESIPTKMGFDFFCGYNCQRIAHTYYPTHLYKNENRLHLNNDTVAPHTKLPKGADSMDIHSYRDFNLNEYAPDVMFGEMMNFIDENKNDPFFFYWASPIPHLALQTPQNWVDYYVNKLGDEKPYLGEKGYFPSRYPRATYAAMISYLDEKIGQLVQKLKDEGIYNNTLIIFTSDNGPSYTGGVDAEYFNSAGPFSNAYGFTKGFVHEGGIRVPMIASWPGKIKAGSTTDHMASFQDILPTLSKVSDTENTVESDGISFYPTLISGQNQAEHAYLYWEFPGYNGQQAVRMGDWKAIRKNIKNGQLVTELYNLKNDLKEKINVADDYPEVVKKMEQIMKESHSQSELEKFRMEALGDDLPE